MENFFTNKTNQKLFVAIANLLRDYQKRYIELDHLVILLEAAKDNLIEPNSSWLKQFNEYWEILEITNAMSLSEDEENPGGKMKYLKENQDDTDQTISHYLCFIES